jgi:NitT/TauT family transport system substrate-binding protein
MPDLTRGLTRRRALTGASLLALPSIAKADVTHLRMSHGYSTGYLPMMVMRDQHLLEKHAAKAGLGTITIDWRIEDGGNIINDAMLAGVLDIAGIGVPGYLILHDRTAGKRSEIIGISALNTGSLWLNSIDPKLKTLADYGPGDRIALPGIKTSYAAVVLEMAAAKEFGAENYAKLDPLTVGLPHPESMAALLSGKTEITSHLASSPFSYKELKDPKVHRVMSTRDVVGPMSILMAMTPRAFADANPGIIKAYLAAQEEANGFINHDHKAASALYIRVTNLHVSEDDLMDTLNDPENTYDSAPHGSMAYASFLSRIGTLKNTPASWQDLFLPYIKDLPGS